MKTYLLIILCLCTQVVFAQRDFASRDKFKINNQVCYGDSRASVISNLGVPMKEEDHFNEMDETNNIVMFYGQSKIYIENDMVRAFAIRDNSLSVSYENVTFSVGGNISVLQGLFPNSYSARGSNISENGTKSSVFITLKAAINGTVEVPIDEFIAVHYNPNTNIITEIIKGRW